MSKFVDRVVGRTPPEGGGDPGDDRVREPEIVRDPQSGPTASRLVAGYTGSPVKEDDWQPDAAPIAAEQRPVDYANVGEHVSSVLEAATTAAAKITADAEREARDVVARARREAAAAVETARREADKASTEAQRRRADAERETRETTERADAYFAKKRRDAESEASAIVARAKREASEHNRAAQERRSALDKNVALTEERLRQLVGGLRDLSGRLEQLVGAQEPSPNVTDGVSARSLEDSVKPSAVPQQSTGRST